MRALTGRPGDRLISRRIAVGISAATLTLLTTAAGVGTAPAAHAQQLDDSLVSVIVQARSAADARAAVTHVGGTPGAEFALIGGLAAELPSSALGTVRRAAGIHAVTPDGGLELADAEDYSPESESGSDSADYPGASSGPEDRWRSDGDEVALRTVIQTTGADSVSPGRSGAGKPLTGKGVGVALIDSGIAPVKGLTERRRVFNGPDLSFESQASNLRHLDTFGHGTHMAGIILGSDPRTKAGDDGFRGVAPEANLLNMKVAAADGAVDVSQVIAAIDWVVSHRNDYGMNVRVLNLSFGTDSVQDARLDPLSHAVEAAWRHGIVVVVAAGNGGPTTTRLSMPAANPYVIAVGGTDSKGTVDRSDDTIGSFSSRGNDTRSPDLVAPGKSIVSLRSPGSFIDVNHPSGRVTNDPEGRFFRGSGTSQATAITSGAAALLLQQRPNLTPDQVKALLTGTASPLDRTPATLQGAGTIDIAAAAEAPTPRSAVQHHEASLGTGSLDASRGSSRVADPLDGTELTGEQDIMGTPWDGRTWSAAALEGRTWSGGTWNGNGWSGEAWSGSSWAGRTWSSVEWTGRTWSGESWSGRTWSDATWTGRTWSGRTWSGATWTGRTWSGRTWSDGSWSGATWAGAVWSGAVWSGGTWQ